MLKIQGHDRCEGKFSRSTCYSKENEFKCCHYPDLISKVKSIVDFLDLRQFENSSGADADRDTDTDTEHVTEKWNQKITQRDHDHYVARTIYSCLFLFFHQCQYLH